MKVKDCRPGDVITVNVGNGIMTVIVVFIDSPRESKLIPVMEIKNTTIINMNPSQFVVELHGRLSDLLIHAVALE